MKYLYHRPDDGGILMIAHQPEPSNPNPYIEIDDSIANDFFAVKLHLHHFVVTAEGTLKNLYPAPNEEIRAIEKVFAIPKNITEETDCVIQQDTVNQLITVNISATGLELAQLNRFQNQSHCILVACLPSDPHLYVWHWAISTVDLLDGPVTRRYTGENNLQFYTKKIFRTYKNEQLN